MNRNELTIKKNSLSDEEVQKLVQSFNVALFPFCSHCGADHRLSWYGGKRYKSLSTGGSFPIGHCCEKRFEDWIIVIDLIGDDRISEESIRFGSKNGR